MLSDRDIALYWEEALDLPALGSASGNGLDVSAQGRAHVERLRSLVGAKLEPERVLQRVQEYLALNLTRKLEEVRVPIETGGDLLDAEIPERDRMVVDEDGNDILWRGSFHLLGGKRKSFKTFCSFQLALALAQGPGNGWLRFETRGGPWRTLMVVGEGGRGDSRGRLDRLRMIAPREAIERLGFFHPLDPCDGGEITPTRLLSVLASLERPVKERYEHVVIDPLVIFAEGDEDSNTEQREVFKSVIEFGKRTGAAVTVSHHVRKLDDKTKAPTIDSIRGAGVAMDLAETISLLWAQDDDPPTTRHARHQGRYFPDVAPYLMHLDPTTFYVSAGASHGQDTRSAPGTTPEDAIVKIRDFVAKWGGGNVGYLAGILGIGRTTCGRACKELVARGELVPVKDPRNPRAAVIYAPPRVSPAPAGTASGPTG